MVTFLFLCSHYCRSIAIRRARQGGARAVDLPVRSFDLARPGVATPLMLKSIDSVVGPSAPPPTQPVFHIVNIIVVKFVEE